MLIYREFAMHKAIQYSLAFVIMFIFVAISMGQDAFDQTVAQIKTLETKLEENRQHVEREVSEFQESHKLNAPKDMFESDQDYASRKRELVSIVAKHSDNLKGKYLGSIQSQITHLYRRIFSTNDVTITLGPYDANNEFFLITFAFQNQSIERRFDIKKDDARNLYHNWDKVIQTSYLSIDPGYRRALIRVELENPILLQKFTFEFVEVYHLADNNSVAFNSNGTYFTPRRAFISYMDFIKMKLDDGSISSRDPKFLEFLENLVDVIKKYLPHDQNSEADRTQHAITRAMVRLIERLKEGTHPNHRNMATGIVLRARIIGVVAQDFSPRLLGYAFVLSPSGKYLATGHTFLNHSGIAFWEVNSGTKVGQVAHGGTVNAVRFSPDGHYLAAGENNKAITFYRIPKNLTFGDKITKEKVIQTSEEIKDLAWSPYGNLISDGKKIYRPLLQPEIYNIEKPVVFEKP